MFHKEVEDFLTEINVTLEKYTDPGTNCDYLKLPANNILLQLNTIEPNAGKDNQAIADHFLVSGFTLIQVWEDQWIHRKEVIKSRLKALTGKSKTIYGRKTTISRIPNPVLVEFLATNHLNVPLKGKYKYGLFYKNKLVSVASFSYPRKISFKEENLKSYELLRFCHLNGHLVTGGLTKLLNYFIKEVHPDHIMSYIDREWGSGKGFSKAGFIPTSYLAPKYFFVDTRNYVRIYPEKGNNSSLNEDHWVKIFNCGSIKMEYFLTRKPTVLE